MELKQCPFCGAKDTRIVIKGVGALKYAVICEHCDARSGRKPTKQAAIEEWNRREADALALLKAQEPKLVHVTANINHRKIGECPTCGKSINSGDYPNYCGRCGQAVRWTDGR